LPISTFWLWLFYSLFRFLVSFPMFKCLDVKWNVNLDIVQYHQCSNVKWFLLQSIWTLFKSPFKFISSSVYLSLA
jgi:hypothetical protein